MCHFFSVLLGAANGFMVTKWPIFTLGIFVLDANGCFVTTRFYL